MKQELVSQKLEGRVHGCGTHLVRRRVFRVLCGALLSLAVLVGVLVACFSFMLLLVVVSWDMFHGITVTSTSGPRCRPWANGVFHGLFQAWRCHLQSRFSLIVLSMDQSMDH